MKIFVFKKETFIKLSIIAVLVICGVICALIFDGGEATVSGTSTSKMPICSVQTDEKAVMLTIDTAFENDKTEQILEILANQNVKATFAVMGVWAQQNPELVKAIQAGGHEIISHSMAHERYTGLKDDEILSDATGATYMLASEYGVNTPFIRPPYGAADAGVVALLESGGFRPVRWSIDGEDWRGDGADAVTQRVVNNLKGGDIILLQNNTDDGLAALPAILSALKERGYTCKTLSEMMPEGDTFVDNKGVLTVQ